MATTYTYASSFSVAGVGINGATVNAYRASRFSGVPALNASPPGSADATTTTGTAAGFAGAFQIALPTFEDYYISVTSSGTTYWVGPVSQPFQDGTGALGNTAAAGTLGITGDIVVVGGVATLQDTANVEAQTRQGALQWTRRHGSSAWDNIYGGWQQTTTVAAASNGVNVNTFAGAGTLNVAPVSNVTFPSPSGPLYTTVTPILQCQTSGGTVQISYTGTTQSAGNITAITGCTTLNSGAGVLSTGATVFAPAGPVEDVVVCSDSILDGNGSNTVNVNAAVGMTDWFTSILARENRSAGLPDPGRGFRRCISPVLAAEGWNNVGAGVAVASNSVGPGAGVNYNYACNTNGLNNVIGDAFTCRRMLVFVQTQLNGDGVQVNFGSGYSASYDTHNAAYGLIAIDSGDLGSAKQVTLQVKQVAHVNGAGGAGVNVIGYLPYQTDGTTGVVGYNFAQSGAKASDWTAAVQWDALYLPFIQPRRVYMAIGVNDISGGSSISTLQANITTLVQRIQKAVPLAELVLCAQWHIGQGGGIGISNANWVSQYTNMVAGIAFTYNCTFIDMQAWFGDAAIFTVASVTTTNGGASATVASGGYPNVEVGMYVTGLGIPNINQLGGVKVASIAGNTVNFSGNTAGITAGTNTLTFTNDVLGISANDGIHFGDASRSTSGRDAQQGIADMFWNTLSYYRAAPPVAAGPGWTSAGPALALDKTLPSGVIWTRTANTTFTINYPTSQTGIYGKGTKLRWVESGTVKYGVVASSAFSNGITTVTMVATTDYVMAANPDIGSNWYSYGSPPGFPTSFTWSPAWTGFSVNPSTALNYWWSINNGMCTLNAYAFTAGTSNATTFTMVAPISSAAVLGIGQALGTGTDNGAPITLCYASIGASTTTITVAKNAPGGAWTNANGKNGTFTLTYPI